MGYAGGSTKNPTYHNLADHTETVQIDYDPNVIKYDELLSYFFAAHNPFGTALSTQYKSIIFVHDAEQERAAHAAKAALEAETGRAVHTEIVTAWRFVQRSCPSSTLCKEEVLLGLAPVPRTSWSWLIPPPPRSLMGSSAVAGSWTR